MSRFAHLVVTDSGLGGMAVCAGVERALRQEGVQAPPRITYVNAWPEEGRGYNDLPDIAARAEAFDRALAAIDGMAPDLVVIACNTLSIVYEHTAHRGRADVPVRGIVDAGVELFAGTLRDDPAGALVLIGTRTTIESGVHANALSWRGVGAGRVSGASCHGLATAIEADPCGEATNRLIDACCLGAAAVAPQGEPLYVGLCCTHYGFVAERIALETSRHARRAVITLDPNAHLVRDVARSVRRAGSPVPGPEARVQVLSKVRLSGPSREGIARMVDEESPATARALRDYVHVPGLF